MEKDLMQYKKNHYMLWDNIVAILTKDGIDRSEYFKFCDLKYSVFESLFGKKKMDETLYACFLCDYYPKCSVCPLCEEYEHDIRCRLYNDLVYAYEISEDSSYCIECAEKIRDIWGGRI